MNNIEKFDAILQIFRDAGFAETDFAAGGIATELLSISAGLPGAYSPAWCVKLSISEARGLLDRLEHSAIAAMLKEGDDE